MEKIQVIGKSKISLNTIFIAGGVIVLAFTLPAIIRLIKNIIDPLAKLASLPGQILDQIANDPVKTIEQITGNPFYTSPSDLPTVVLNQLYNNILTQVKTIPAGNDAGVQATLNKIQSDGFISAAQNQALFKAYKNK